MFTPKIICFANQKGGVAKSTSCVNTASALLKKGYKVLVIDLDPQCDTSDGFGLTAEEYNKTIIEVLRGECDVDRAIVNTEMGDIIVGSSALSTADREFVAPGREYMLKEALSTIDNYHFILLDTPPNLGWSTLNALTAADYLVVPVTPQKWSNKALGDLKQTIEVIQKRTNSDLEVAGILITKLDERTRSSNLNCEVTHLYAENFNIPVFNAKIHHSVSVDDAFNNGVDLLYNYKNSRPAQDYFDFAAELLEKVA